MDQFPPLVADPILDPILDPSDLAPLADRLEHATGGIRLRWQDAGAAAPIAEPAAPPAAIRRAA